MSSVACPPCDCPLPIIRTIDGEGVSHYRLDRLGLRGKRPEQRFRYGLSWADLVKLQPKLFMVQDEAARGGRESRWPYLKRLLSGYVGWNASINEPILQSAEAWNVACRHIRDTFELPGGAR